MHGKLAQSLERLNARQSEVQSEAGARSRADPIKIPVCACSVVFGQCQVPGPDGGLFDCCAVYLFQSRWRDFVARSQQGLVRTGGSLQ